MMLWARGEEKGFVVGVVVFALYLFAFQVVFFFFFGLIYLF